MSLIGLLWKQRPMDETEEHTRKSIKKLIELGVSIETIADRLDLDIDFTTMIPILSDD